MGSTDSTDRHDDVERIVSRRRGELADRANLDPRVRALARSGHRVLLPPRVRGGRPTLALVALAALGALALVACTVSATAVVIGGSWFQRTLSDPTTTIESFYGALQQQDYATAYTYFTRGARAHLSEHAFANQFGGYDVIDGPVASYSVRSSTRAADGAGQTIVVAVTRKASATPQLHTLVLLNEQGQWHIESVTIQFDGAASPPPPGK